MRRNVLNLTPISSFSINREDNTFQHILNNEYDIKVGVLVTLLLLLSSTIVYQIFENYVPNDTYTFVGKRSDNKIFFLKSTQTIEKLGSFGIEKKGYLDRLKQIEKLLVQQGYVVEYISEKDLETLPIKSVLFALDTISLNDNSLKHIENYMSNGGFLVFNYHFAYNSADRFRGNEAIQRITGLKSPKNIDHISNKNEMFLVPRILSPLTQKMTPLAKRVHLHTIDPLPIFVSNQGIEPDFKLSNWPLSSTPTITESDKSIPLKSKEAGVVWHGQYKQGNWAYISFPSYSMVSIKESIPVFKKFLGNIVEFSSKPATVISYPYVDAKKIILVSEDTEYKYSSFDNFIDAAEKYKFPVSAYCVSSLANEAEYFPMMKKAGKSKYLEIGSYGHSQSKIIGTSEKNIRQEIKGSKKILGHLTKRNITGFRLPREELDKAMIKELVDAGYTYILTKNKGYLYPQEESKGLYTIPRTATDDYQYLVNLEWDRDKVIQRMIFETEHITSLDGVYALSVHTHLMAYKKNIEMLESYFKYVQQRSDLTALTGEELISRVKQRKKIALDIKQTSRNFLIDVKNNNVEQVDKLTFRIFWTKPINIENIQSEIRGISVEYKNNSIEHYTDVTILDLKPLSSLKLIAKHTKATGNKKTTH